MPTATDSPRRVRSGFQVMATYEYDPGDPSQMTLVAGETYLLLDDSNVDWMMLQSLDGQSEGYAPSNFLARVQDD